MSLRACVECRKQISDQAEVCPACGGKQPTGLTRGRLAILIVLGLPVLIGVFSRDDGPVDPPRKDVQAAAPERTIDASPQTQANRKALIEQFVREGLFARVMLESDLPHVYVGRRFYDLDFELKEKFVSVVAAYNLAANPKGGYVIIQDAKSNKEVGSYSTTVGLDLE